MLDADPVGSCMVASRVADHGVEPSAIGGELWTRQRPTESLCYAGANLILFIPGFWYGIRGTQIRLAQIFQALVPGVLAAGAVAVILAAASGLGASIAAPFRLGCASLITMLTIGIGCFVNLDGKARKPKLSALSTLFGQGDD